MDKITNATLERLNRHTSFFQLASFKRKFFSKVPLGN